MHLKCGIVYLSHSNMDLRYNGLLACLLSVVVFTLDAIALTSSVVFTSGTGDLDPGCESVCHECGHMYPGL